MTTDPLKPLKASRGESSKLSATDEQILRAVHETLYGSVEVTIHNARVVQVERREKIRFPAAPGFPTADAEKGGEHTTAT